MALSTKTPEVRLGAKGIPCDALVDALPHPLLVISKGLAIEYVNTAAEDFFQMSASILCRQSLPDVVAFGCQLIALVEQVQRNGTTVNEYGVELSSFRFESTKLGTFTAGRSRSRTEG